MSRQPGGSSSGGQSADRLRGDQPHSHRRTYVNPATASPDPLPPPGLSWGIKRSFIDYIGGLPDGSVSATAGATVSGSSLFCFSPDTSDYDAATRHRRVALPRRRPARRAPRHASGPAAGPLDHLHVAAAASCRSAPATAAARTGPPSASSARRNRATPTGPWSGNTSTSSFLPKGPNCSTASMRPGSRWIRSSSGSPARPTVRTHKMTGRTLVEERVRPVVFSGLRLGPTVP